jgi:hypothetical protein
LFVFVLCTPGFLFFWIVFVLLVFGTQDEEKQNKNNPEKLATWGTQDEEKQSKNNPEKLVR